MRGGVTHYTDQPPLNRNTGHAELNSYGVVIRYREKAAKPAKTTVDNKVAQQKHLEKQKRDHLDKILLQTFTTERDLLATRDDRLSTINSAIELSEWRINQWNTKLAELSKKMQAYESIEDAPESVKDAQAEIQRRISQSEADLLEQKQVHKRTAEQFDRDLVRYRALKTEN